MTADEFTRALGLWADGLPAAQMPSRGFADHAQVCVAGRTTILVRVGDRVYPMQPAVAARLCIADKLIAAFDALPECPLCGGQRDKRAVPDATGSWKLSPTGPIDHDPDCPGGPMKPGI